MTTDAVTTMLHDMNGALGEMRGQLREMIHQSNNTAHKLDTMYDNVAAIKAQLSDVENLRGKVATLEKDVDDLKQERSRRIGAMGLGDRILKSPLIGWIIGAALAAWAFLHGRPA